MAYLKKGAKFKFAHGYRGEIFFVSVEVLEECKPCAMAALGRPYITGPGPYLRLTPMLNGQPLPKTHPLNKPFKGGARLLAAAQTAYHHQGDRS